MARFNYKTIAAGLLLVATATGCKGNRSELPPVHIIQNMDFQQRYDAQERNDFFEDGRAMRQPPEGVVAFGSSSTAKDPHLLKADPHMYTGRDASGKHVDALPKSLEPGLKDGSLLARGEDRYNIFCAPCHGETGRGDGMAVRKAGAFKVNPPSYHQAKMRPLQLGYLYRVINEGKGTMLPYAAQIPVEDRWAIAAWVRTLQKHGEKMNWQDDVPAAPESDDKKEGK
jgi:mono/diheme cytochrome c family protein